MPPLRFLAVLTFALAALLGGCTSLPESRASRAAAAPPPVLVPLAGILAEADALAAGAAVSTDVDARAAALRAKADRLRRD